MSIKATFNEEKVRHLHYSRVATVKATTPLSEVLQQMQKEKAGVALILNEEQQLCGIFTERDVLLKVLNTDGVDQNVPIESLMTPNPYHLSSEDSVGDAVRLMVEHKVRNIPLVDQGNHVQGEINILSIVEFLVEHFPNEIYNLPPQPNQQLTSAEGA